MKGLLFIDVWHVTVPALYTGERNVLGSRTALGYRKTVRMSSKADAPRAIELILAYHNSVGNPCTWLHCDGAKELSGAGVFEICRARGIRVTTTVANRSRQNPMEPDLRVAASKMRKELAQGRGLPYACWSYAMDHAEEGSMLQPSREPPHSCKLGDLLNMKPPGSFRRPFACLASLTVAPRLPNGTLVNKCAEQGEYCLHMGYEGGRSGSFECLTKRSQAGYILWRPEQGCITVSDDVSFYPDCFPGVQRTSKGGWCIPRERIPWTDEGRAALDRTTPAVDEPSEYTDVKDGATPAESLDVIRGFYPELPSRGGDDRPYAADEPAGEPSAEPAPERATLPPPKTLLLPRSHYPEYDCDEHSGRGWEVQVTQRRGEWSKCKLVQPSADGSLWADVWCKHKLLLPVPDSSATADVLPEQPLEPAPNKHTMPAPGLDDPLVEPTRPRRDARPVERYGFTAAALCAAYTEKLGLGYDVTSAKFTTDMLLVDTDSMEQRIVAGLAARGEDLALHAACLFEFGETELESQRLICLAADHGVIESEYGARSPQAIMARELYATGCVAAVQAGLTYSPLDPLYTDLSGELEPAHLGDIFGDAYSGHLMSAPGGQHLDLALLSQKKSSPDIFTEREMRGPRWDTPKQLEIDKMRRLNAFDQVAADDPSIAGLPVGQTCWSGRCKRGDQGQVIKDNARCCHRGDLDKRIRPVDPNLATSPVVRHQSNNSLDAVGVLRDQSTYSWDVPGAYLQGDQTKDERRILRPPCGFRTFDERGVEIYWSMNVPLYGGEISGAVWNRTFDAAATCPNGTTAEPSMGYERSTNDPCVYSKCSDGGRINMSLYVDDGRTWHDQCAADTAARDLKFLEDRFGVKPKSTNRWGR